MGFRQGAYARVWSAEDKGNYSVGNISISKKNKNTNRYEIEFQDGYVRFVGTAHNDIKAAKIPEKGMSIKITSCDVTNKYDSEKKKTYTNFVIFGFEDANGGGANVGNSGKKLANAAENKSVNAQTDIEEDDDLPF